MMAMRALLAGLIDYAGLFPPASLDMAEAVRNYASYRVSEHAYALGRFVVPVKRLEEFMRAFDEACCAEQGVPWSISVIGSGDSEADIGMLAEFHEGAVFIKTIEIKTEDSAYVQRMLDAIQRGRHIYVEFVPEQCEQMLPLLKKFDARAKIRTGGLTAGAFPESGQLAHVLASCARAKVAFKLTAGLHHPLRSSYKLTYEPDSLSATMHGFVNVFVAAAIAYFGAGESEVKTMMEERSPQAFQWDRDKLTWRGHQLTDEQITTVRENFAISFGSCSFAEPIDDLKALGWL